MFSKKGFLMFCAFAYTSTVIVNSYFLEDENQPTYLTVLVGHYVLLNCEVDFPQNIEIPHMVNWKRGNKTVFSWYNGMSSAKEPYVGRIQPLSEHIEGYGRASINLTAIREDDAGWFECEVIFPNRTPNSRNNGTWFYLTVNGGNVVAIPPVNQTTMEGEEAQFTCAAKENHTIITWFKDNVSITKLNDLLRRTVVTEQGTLIIYPTSMSDLGEYECEAMNSRGEVQRVRAYLDVQYKAKVISTPSEVYLPFGKPAVLDCDFRANPPLSNLRWEKDGFLFDPYNVKGVFYRRNGSLYFSNVEESHNGYYSCTPYNALGTEGPSPNIHVIVQRPPSFLLTPHNLYLRKRGETLEMPCDARDGSNEHKPLIVWYKKDGTSLPVGRYIIEDGNLTIINVQQEDRGIYLCSATNEAATITAEAELIVENVPPNAPYNLTATSSQTSVHLKWNAGKTGSHVEYSIWYRPKHSPSWKTARIDNAWVLEANITDLSPGREYEFMVLSQNRHGDGLFSKSIRVWTKGLSEEADRYSGIPFADVGVPRNLTIHLTSGGFLVKWEPPEYGVESLKLYRLKWWYHGMEEYTATAVEVRTTSYLVTGLESGYDYDFQVIAVSVTDREAKSDALRLNYPGGNLKAVSAAVISIFALFAVAFVIYFCTKRKWWSRPTNKIPNEKK